MSMKPKLEALLEGWLGRWRATQRATSLPTDSSLVDHLESRGDANGLLSSTSVLAGGLSLSEDGRSRPSLPERRASDRVVDRSTLLVMGEDADGHPLTENATIHDVGLGGISFFLTSPVAVGQVLDLILSSREFGTLEGSATFRVQATVLRSARPSRAVRPYLVAAEFKGEFATLNCAINLVTTADEIKKAVQFDERMREGTMPLG
jgi:hypothetical protein